MRYDNAKLVEILIVTIKLTRVKIGFIMKFEMVITKMSRML